MTKDQAQFLVTALENNSNGESRAELYEGYSGRGMYGDKTTGVVFSRFGELLEAALVEAKENSEELPDFEGADIRQDSLGMDIIIY